MLSEAEALAKICAEINKTLDSIRKDHAGYGTPQPWPAGTDDRIIARLSECIDHHDAEQLEPQIGYISSLVGVVSLLEINGMDGDLELLVSRYCEILGY